MTPAVREMFDDLEKVLDDGNVLRARRYFKISGMEREDANQEIRLAIIKSLRGYDFNRADGEILPYVRTIMYNTLNELYARSKRLYRNPHHKVEAVDGGRSHVILAQADYDTVIDLTADASGDACTGMIERETNHELGGFIDELCDLLRPREREILFCRIAPPPELVEIMAERAEENPSNVSLAKHLGLRKNQVDWAWYKIRMRFTDLVGDDAFSEVFGEDIVYEGWPLAHVSKGSRFHDQFVARTLRERGLSATPHRPARTELSEVGTRIIEEYKWGVTLRCIMDGLHWTAVLEGRFASRTGELFGRCGARKLVPIDGYGRLARSMAEGTMPDRAGRPVRPLPVCIGDYEPGEPVCDGDLHHGVCAFRDTCVALQLRMREKSTTPGAYLEERKDSRGAPYAVAKDPVKFNKIIAAMTKAYDVHDGKAHRSSPPPAPRGHSKAEAPLKVARAEVAAKLASNATKGVVTVKPLPLAAARSVVAKARRKGEPIEKHRTEASIKMDEWLKQWLKAISTGVNRSFAKDDELAQPGQLFLRDRRLTSGYVGLYCRRADGKEVAVASIYYKPRNKNMDMKLPLTVDKLGALSAAALKALKFVPTSDGVFKCVANGLDQMGIGIGAEAVVKLVNAGSIVLPD